MRRRTSASELHRLEGHLQPANRATVVAGNVSRASSPLINTVSQPAGHPGAQLRRAGAAQRPPVIAEKRSRSSSRTASISPGCSTRASRRYKSSFASSSATYRRVDAPAHPVSRREA